MIETAAKFGMGALLLVSVPPTPDPELWAQWGLAGAVVAFTLARDWNREKRMSEALEKHQAWTQQTLLNALERNTKAIERINSSLGGCPMAKKTHDIEASNSKE